MELAQAMLAWLLSVVVILAAYPWAAWLIDLTPDGRSAGGADWLLGASVMLAISTGGLTLLILAQDMLGLTVDYWRTTLIYLLLMAVGWHLRRRGSSPRPVLRWPDHWLTGLALAVLLVTGAAVLFNAAYWPFYRDDAIGIYHRLGRALYLRGTIIGMGDEGPYSAYPMLASMLYTYTYLASGWINEYLAGFMSALLSLANLPVAYLLGREIGGRRAGWLAALLLGLSPAFSSWASSGYVDLPMAFFYTLAALFALRMWRRGHWADALLAGGMIGLAAWTKNAALVGVGVLALWVLAARVYGRISWRAVVAAGVGCAAIAAPWYLRNLALDLPIIPATAWVDRAEQSIDLLLIFLTRPTIYGVTGIVMFAGLLLTGGLVVYRWRAAPAWAVMLLWWVLPLYVAWWLFVSYDPRFLLLFLPVMSIMGAWWLLRLWDWLPGSVRPVLLAAGLVLVVVITVQNTWDAVDYKDDFLLNLLMSHQEKVQLVRPR